MSGFSLTYIYHDCFLLETNSSILIFDYWKDPLSSENKDFPPLLQHLYFKEKKIYLIVSHHHKDHFSRRIFLWQKLFPQIKYIISKDVAKSVRYLLSPSGVYSGYRAIEDSVKILSPGDIYKDDNVEVEAFKSTDIGNSYGVRIEGLTFFHAGDLNAWIWKEESSSEEVELAISSYTKVVDEIHSKFPYFDLVMFPVDSRLGQDYWWGAKYFADTINIGMFVPMHFELVEDERDKEKRRIDAAKFELYKGKKCRNYLQLASTRSVYMHK